MQPAIPSDSTQVPSIRRLVPPALLATLLATFTLHRPALGIERLDAGEPARAPRTAAELEQRWDAILNRAVSDGVVDYALLARRQGALRELVASLASFGPRSHPHAFQSRESRLAYYINAYNTFVVYAVIEHGVRTSVRDVSGWIEPADGFGFFWALRFDLDGESVHLYGLENSILRPRFQDPRVHAAINCASRSCPRLWGEAYHARTLDSELDRAAAQLASEPHVVLGSERQVISLSSIYDWYADDFAQPGAARSDALPWILDRSQHREALERAIASGWSVEFVDYDWSLNGHWNTD